jgi:16S rRNA (guanine(1405)-N(7))-methyltransferase
MKAKSPLVEENNKTPAAMVDLTPYAADMLDSSRYRGLDIPLETALDLLEQEWPHYKHPKDAIDAARKKLHTIVAAYLGDPDYAVALPDLDAAFASGDPQAVKAACTRILSAHASTRERLPILEMFYSRLFAVTGTPVSVLDLACGLNPFALPWMNLPTSVHYHAYDLNHPRVDAINHFFSLQQLPPLAVHDDFLLHPPTVTADVAFLFKEAHRMEQRQRGRNRPLWEVLDVHWLLVSLPMASLSGKHNLIEKHRTLVYSILSGLPWKVEEVLFENEMVFCIDKRSG